MPRNIVTVIPDPGRTMEGLRDTGYSFETSVADLVDNAIAANATTIDISVQRDLRGRIRLTIADNGDGMDSKHLQEGMTYGSPRRPGSGQSREVRPRSQDRFNRLVSPPFGSLPAFRRSRADHGYLGPRLRSQSWRVATRDYRRGR